MATKKNFSDFMFIGQTETDSPRKNGYNLYERERGREGGEKKMSGRGGGRGGREEGGEGRGNMHACVFWGLRVWCICTRFGNTVFSVKEDVSCL